MTLQEELLQASRKIELIDFQHHLTSFFFQYSAQVYEGGVKEEYLRAAIGNCYCWNGGRGRLIWHRLMIYASLQRLKGKSTKNAF